MNSKYLEKIFTVPLAMECLEHFKPELFKLPTQRSKIKRFKGLKSCKAVDLWPAFSDINCYELRDYIRDYSISEEGKYWKIHNNLEYTTETISRTLTNQKSPCFPQQFSESIVKPLIRKYLDKRMTEPIAEYVEREMLSKLIIHATERMNQQLKADYTEYIIMLNCSNIIPTLKHTNGTDMYLLNDDCSIEELDIKTTNNIWKNTDPKEAIKELYERQGEDRFDYNPRLYIYRSGNPLPNAEDIINQLNQKHDIIFTYKNQEYNVKGARLIIV